MEQYLPLIIQLVSGAIGGNLAGKVLKKRFFRYLRQLYCRYFRGWTWRHTARNDWSKWVWRNGPHWNYK